MNKCLTKKLLFKGVSGCLVEKPDCAFARQFGFSFVCCHPYHEQLQAHVVGAMTKEDAHERYVTLRRIRHDEFVAGLDEESRNYFLSRDGFP